MKKVFAYTNHTVLPEALEKWPVSLMKTLLPRISEIIYEINRRWLNEVKEVFGEDWNKLSALSIIEGDGEHQMIRMANLAIVGSYKVRLPLRSQQRCARLSVRSHWCPGCGRERALVTRRRCCQRG